MASGQHFKVIKGKKSEGIKKFDKRKYDQNFDNIFRKKDKMKPKQEK